MNIKDEDILVTGSEGLVGKEIQKLIPNCVKITHRDFDLTNENDVKYMFKLHSPKCVIHLAAKVGGILDNSQNQAVYFDQNILMNTFMVKHSYLNGVSRFIGILSSCIYPDVCDTYPLELDCIHDGPPSITNFSYGYAKRCLAVQIDSYNKQYGTKYNYVMPCNLYGPHDKLDEKKSHFVAALLVKIKKALKNKEKYITLMGDGTPLRQFMHSRDLSKIIKYMVDNNIYNSINIAPNENYSIEEIANISLKSLGITDMEIRFDKTKPNGQYRKDISNNKLMELMPDYKFIPLVDGIKEMFEYIDI